MTIDELEKELRQILKGEFSSLHITFNEPAACNYASVEKFETEYSGDDAGDWISEEERRKGYASNSRWAIQWYPDTPVGFYCVAASTLKAAIGAVLGWTDSPGTAPR